MESVEFRGRVAKSEGILRNQVALVTNLFGESIAPYLNGEIYKLSLADLNTRFSVRYEMYLESLRSARRNPAEIVQSKGKIRLLHSLNALDSYIETQLNDENSRVLLDRQVTAFEDLRAFLESGGREGFIKLPTGSGKTVLFTEFVEATDLKTLIVVPTKILVNQTVDRFQEFAPDVETGKVYQESKDYSRQVTITTYSSFLKNVEKGIIDPSEYELLVLDEVHKALSRRRSAAVTKFMRALRLGFTATPRYTQDKQVGNLLASEIHTMGIREAVEEGILSSLSVYLAQTDIDLSGVKLTQYGNYDEEDLEKAVNIAIRNTAAVDLYKNLFLGLKGISYCVTVRHALDLATRFNDAGLPAAVMSGYQTRGEQQEVLDRFRRGEVQMLCNADILIEGFDEPSISICLNLRPTTSPVMAEQRAGRVLRLDPDNPGKHAYIVDFIDQFEDPDYLPVSFAQIVEGAHVFKKNALPPDESGGGRFGRPVYPDIQITGLRVITEAEEILRVVREMEDRKYKSPEEGWLSVMAVSRRFRMSKPIVYKFMGRYRESHPEYFQVFKSPAGHVAEYFSPELVEIIAEARSNLQAPVEGWLSISQLSNELGVSINTIERLIREQREIAPDNFKVFRRTSGSLVEHFSPGMISFLRRQVEAQYLQFSSPPEGWFSYPQLAKELGTERDTAVRLSQKFRELHPEFFAKFRNRSGQVREYISTELLEELRKTWADIPVAGSDWINKKKMAELLGINEKTVERLVSRYRIEKPDFFQILKTSKGYLTEHLSHSLLVFLREERNKFSRVEEGWVTYPTLALVLGIARSTAAKLAEKYRETYFQYFREFISPDGNIREYISDELMNLLKQGINQVPVPKGGWMNRLELERTLGIDYQWTASFVEQYRNSHPGYFSIFRGTTNHIAEYYSPEFVAVIEREYSSIASPIEGWIDRRELARKIGLSERTSTQIAERYRKTHPHYFRQYRGENGKRTYFMDPSLIELIQGEIIKVTEIEPGWLNLSQLKKELRMSGKRINEVVEEYRVNHPEYFRRLRGQKNQATEYFSPELIYLLKQKERPIKASLSTAPDGWMNLTQMQGYLGISRQTISRRIKVLRVTQVINSEYFKDSVGKRVEYFAPEFMEGVLKSDADKALKTAQEISSFVKSKLS